MPAPLTPRRSAALAVLGAILLLLGGAPSALAEPVTVSGQHGTKVTFGTDQPRPGERVTISGTGFVPVAAPGNPHIAIKVDDGDVDGFVNGGPSRVDGDRASAKMWFIANAAGEFSGWIDVPSTFTAPGPNPGGLHSWRILSGAFSDTGGPYSEGSGPGATAPVTFTVPFRVRTQAELGASGTVAPATPAGSEVAFTPGTTFRRSPAPVQASFGSVRLADAEAGAPVEVRINDVVVPSTAVTPSAQRRVRFAVPLATDLGRARLTVTVGGIAETHDIRIVDGPTASISTSAVRPGGLVGYRFSGYTAVDGRPQKVALVVDEQTLACVTADAGGSGSGVVALRADTTTGVKAFGFAAGTNCLGPTGRQDDLPASRIAPNLDVRGDAPTASSSSPVAAGRGAALSGGGFVAGRQVGVALDGTDTRVRLTVAADGTFAGELPVPAATSPGDHVLTFSSEGTTALARLTTTAPVVDPPVVVVPPVPEAPPAGPPSVATPAPTTPTATPAPKPAPPANATIKSLKVKGSKVRVNIGSILGRRTTVSVKSAARIRATRRAKAKVVTFAATATTKAGVVTIALRKDGLAALRRLREVAVVVRLAPKGGAVVTRRLVLRR